MKLKLLPVIILLFLSSGLLKSQSLNLRFSTYFYGWQRADTVTASGSEGKTTHMRGYQNLLLEFNKNKWSFNTLVQTDEDVVGKNGDGFNYRFYNLYIKGANLFNNMLDLKLGRQYVYAGVGKGAVDGLYFKVKAGKNKEYQLAGFGGVVTPYDYSFKNYPDLKDNYMVGGQFSYYGVRDLFVGLSYVNKRRQLPSYSALRLDTAFNTKEILIEPDSRADQLAGLDFNYTYKLVHNFYGKAYFDVNRLKFYRGELNARFKVIENTNVSVGYIYHEPQLSYNTIFWVFEHKQSHEIEGGVDYTLKNGINIYARLSDVIYNKSVDSLKNNSLKINVGFSHPSFGLNFVRYMGYSGESDGINGYFQRELIKPILSANVAVSFSRYYLGEFETDKVNSFSGLLGFTYRPLPQLSIDAQGQFMFNRIYKSDTRFLIGINYWLFKKF
jgi:hypothetical protein